MNSISRTLAALIALGAFSSCKPTTREVLDGFREGFNAKRRQLAEIAANLPPPGTVKKNACSVLLDPKPVYDDPAQEFNLDILPGHLLDHPDSDVDRKMALDLYLAQWLLTSIRWTGPKNPMSESAMKASATEQTTRNVEAALSYPWLVVYRTVQYTPPVAQNEKTFYGGSADVEAFVVDMKSRRPVCSLRFTAESASRVEYKVHQEKRDGAWVGLDDPLQRLEAFAYATLWEDSRKKLVSILQTISKGRFVLRT